MSFVGPDDALVAGVCVDVYREPWAGRSQAPTSEDLVDSVCAGDQSSLVVPGVEGERLLVRPPAPFADAWAPDVVEASGPVVVRLVPAGSVSGWISEVDGFTRAVGVTVVATPLEMPAGGVVPQSAVTDKRGGFQLRLAPGRYRFMMRRGVKQQVLTQGRHPALIKVRAGVATELQQVSFGAEAKPLPTTVRIQVVGASTQAPVPGVCVVPVGRDWPDPTSAVPPFKCGGGGTSNTDGRVQLQVDGEGGLPLAAWGRDGGYVAGVGKVKLRPGSTVTATLEVVAYAGVRGRVVDASTGEPIVGVCPRLEVGGVAVVAQRLTCSDAKGWWEVAAAPGGTVVVVLSGGAGHETRYVPGVTTAAKALKVTLEPGLTVVRRTVLPAS